MGKKPGDYELMPHDKIEALRNELAKLKGERKADAPQSTNVLDAMQNLTETLDHFMELFQSAIEEMKIEEREEELISTELKPLHEKLDQILDQNQKIAQGVVALADMLNRDRGQIRVPQETSSLFSTLGPPPMTKLMPPPPPLGKR